MKNITILLLLASLSCFGQKVEVNKKNIIKTEPLLLLTKGYSLSYERLLSKKTSAEFSFFFRNFQTINPSIDKIGTRNLRLSLKYNIYPFNNKKAPIGWHIGPRLDYTETTDKDFNQKKYIYTNFSTGVEIGYQLGFGKKKNFLLDLAGGYFADFTLKSPDNSNNSPTSIDLNIRLGYRF